jgi:hypothetical protein
MDIIYIIIFILIIIVIYLIYKTSSCSFFEHFDIKQDVKTTINEIFKVNLDSMRTLGKMAKDIVTNADKVTLPGNNLIFNGNIKFNKFYNKTIDILPLGTIILIAKIDGMLFPYGWAPCDGVSHGPNLGAEFTEGDIPYSSMHKNTNGIPFYIPSMDAVATPKLNNPIDNDTRIANDKKIELIYIIKVI